jgi:hypothetical protein
MRMTLAIIALSLFPFVAGAEVVKCADPLLSADAANDDIANLVCSAAIQAKALFASCGLEQQEPITIQVVEAAMHPSFGTCLAIFDLRSGCLQVTDIAGLQALLPEGDPRATLPSEVLFAAAITHEMAHAVVQQAAGEIAIGGAEQEFIANAFEMASLDPSLRDVLLAADPVDPDGALSLVHLSIYALAPRVFANNAWALFDREEFGCSFVQKIVAGEYRFPRH